MTEEKEWPILFSPLMVRQILAERKTATRRRLGKNPERNPNPYGPPGSKLYVRERWGLPVRYREGIHGPLTKERPVRCELVYAADHPNTPPPLHENRWRPGMLLPRWGSRVFLRHRHSFLQPMEQMTHADALEEGFDTLDDFIRYWDELNPKERFEQVAKEPVRVVRFTLLGHERTDDDQ